MSESLELHLTNSEDTMNSSSASTILLRGESLSEEPKDAFENVLYRTTQDDNKTQLTFVSNVFFQDFLSKMQSDFTNSMSPENATCISRCSTHVKGLRCEIVMDSDKRTVCVTGVGHKMWKEWRFVKIAHSLFKQFVETVDANGQVGTFDNENESQQFSNTDVSANIGANTSMPLTPTYASTPFHTQPPAAMNENIVTKLVEKIDNMER